MQLLGLARGGTPLEAVMPQRNNQHKAEQKPHQSRPQATHVRLMKQQVVVWALYRLQ